MKNNFTLLLADHPEHANNFDHLSGRKNITFIQASNAGEALLLGEKYHDADLVLVSADLEGMRDFDTVRELVNQHRERPVILLSNYINLSTIKLAGLLGCRDVLKSPVDDSSLFSLLNSYA